MGLRSYVVARIVLMIPTLFLLVSLIFLIIRVLPGDPALLHFEKQVDPAAYAELRARLGLDQPIYIQYIVYIAGLFTGNLGLSMQDYSPVAQGIFSAFPATLELAIFSMIIASSLGVLLGVRGSTKYNSLTDHSIRIYSIALYAVPVFFLGIIFQMIFGVWLHVLPTGGRMAPLSDPVGLIVPASMSSGSVVPFFALLSLITLAPLMACLTLYSLGRIESEGRTLKNEFKNFFLVFLVSSIAFGVAEAALPVLLAAPLAASLTLFSYLIIYRGRHETIGRNDWLISFIVYFIVTLVYLAASSLVPLIVLCYLAGLVPSTIFLSLLKKRHMKPHVKDFIIPLLVFIVVQAVITIVGLGVISSGTLTLRTGLFTVDSILEGSAYKFIQSIRYLILPSLTLGIVLSGIFLRLTRTNMLDTLRLDYVTSARARGLRERTVIYGYALRNAFLPVLTMMGLQFATLLAGAILTETTFSWPGLGRYIVERISFRDYTAIQGAVVVFGVFVMVVSLVVDLLYAYLDPRIRL
jgi:peptide/nickel transport system permease protein